MRLFDLHCDTATVCYPKGETLTENQCVVSFSKAARFFSQYGQVFAVFTPEELDTKTAQLRAFNFLSQIRAEISASRNTILCQKSDDFKQIAKKQENIALISLENSTPLCNNTECVQTFYDLGVRIVSLTWNHANRFAGGYLDDVGLTSRGRQLVRILQQAGILLDISHLGSRAAKEILCIYDLPVLASHSNCRSVCSHGRNLDDVIIRELIARGGIIGLNLYAPFLSDTGVADYEQAFRHIDHLLSINGQNNICIGADFDGAPMPPCFDGFCAMTKWYDDLVQRGLDHSLCDRIFYQNAFDFFKKAL